MRVHSEEFRRFHCRREDNPVRRGQVDPMNTSLSSARGVGRSRKSIVIPLALLAASLAVAGFWPGYFGPLVRGGAHPEWFFGAHAALFLGWIGLVILQSFLASTGRVALHIRIGRIGMIYGAALVASGVFFALFLFARRAAAGGAGPPVPLLAAFTDMLVFSLFLSGAWFTRRRPQLHRRFILLATNTIIIAGVGRLFGGTRSIALGDVIPFLAVWLSPVWIAMAYDWWRERRIHNVYVFGVLLLVALRYRQLLRNTAAWEHFLNWLTARLM
jgi:hypothetical protein